LLPAFKKHLDRLVAAGKVARQNPEPGNDIR
jgi:hypothetical protein